MVQTIAIDNIKKEIRRNPILQAVQFSITAKEICLIIGANGAGKTTLLKCMVGLLKPDSGHISIDGNITHSNMLLPHCGTVLHYPDSFFDITIEQLFTEHFAYMRIPQKIDTAEYLAQVEVSAGTHTRMSALSLGMRQRIFFALALSHEPSFLVLDEPFNGLDRDGIVLIQKRLLVFKEKGGITLMTGHSFDEMEEIATSIVFMQRGKTEPKISVAEIKQTFPGGLKEYYNSVKARKET